MKILKEKLVRSGGQPFFQFPTTFHDVVFPDGKKKKMMSYEQMNTDFLGNTLKQKLAKVTADKKELLQGFLKTNRRTTMKTLREKLVKAGFKVEAKEEKGSQEFDTKEDAKKFVDWIKTGSGKEMFEFDSLHPAQGNRFEVTFLKK